MIRQLDARARLPRLGVIRLGIKAKNAAGKEYPQEVEYFVLPDSLRAAGLGEKPTTLSVLFPSDDPARVLTSDYVRYQGRVCTLKCDGERFTEFPMGGGEVVGACRLPASGPCSCGAKALGRLHVIVLDGPVGVWQVPIGGLQRIADLLSELEVFRRVFGKLTEVPFRLERIPTSVQVQKEDGTRMAKTGYPVHIRCAFTAAQALRARGIDLKALPAAVDVEEPEELPEEAVSEAPAPPPAPAAPPALQPPAPSVRVGNGRKAKSAPADPGPTSGGPPLFVQEWVEAFEHVPDGDAALGLWHAVQDKATWEQFTLDQQTVIIDAKDAAKRRLFPAGRTA